MLWVAIDELLVCNISFLPSLHLFHPGMQLHATSMTLTVLLWQPTALLFAKHRMYRYKGSKTSTELVTFAQKALDGELEGEEIPPERSFFQQYLGHRWKSNWWLEIAYIHSYKFLSNVKRDKIIADDGSCERPLA